MSIFDDVRDDPDSPVALSPEAASKGGPDSHGGGGLDVSFFLDLGFSLGSLAQTLKDDHDRRNYQPGDAQLFASGVVPASGTIIFDLGSVPLGRVWHIRRLAVGGVTVTATAAGTAWAFTQGAPPNDLNLTNLVDSFTPLPAVHRYGTHQFFLRPTEHLWVAITTGTATQQYACNARVEDWDGEAFAGRFGHD